MLDTALLTEEYRGGLLDLTHYGYISVVDENGKVTANAAGKVLVGLLSDSDLLAESYVLITVE